MITVEEMKKCLAKEYGITSYEQLEKELKKMGGMHISKYVIEKKKCSSLLKMLKKC